MTIQRALLALLDRKPEAADMFAELAATHSDPEALFMYGACQARAGDAVRALPSLVAAIDGGFAVPQALAHPWLEPLRGEPALARLLERAQASRRQAELAFREAGGPGAARRLESRGVRGARSPPASGRPP